MEEEARLPSVEVEDLTATLKKKDIILPSNLFTSEDVGSLLSSCEHPMLSAFVAFMDEVEPREGGETGEQEFGGSVRRVRAGSGQGGFRNGYAFSRCFPL